MKTLGIILTLFSVVAGVYGGFSVLDSRYALASDQKQLEIRVSLGELNTLLLKSLENLYFYREQARKYPEDVVLQVKLQEAEEEVSGIKNRIFEIEKAKV